MKLSRNDIAIFCTLVGGLSFVLVAIINKYLGLPFYEPLQTAILLIIVQGILVKK